MEKLWYNGKTMVLWTKIWYYGQNYGTIEKTMVLYRKQWNFGAVEKPFPVEFKLLAISSAI